VNVFFVFLDDIHITQCYSNTVAIQPFFFEVCSNDLALAVSRFLQMFQSVITFWLPLASAALILYLKTAALGCVNDIML